MEGRKYSRIEACHPILYYCEIYPRPKVASTLDLSLGGLRIETRYSLIVHEGLVISIAIQPQVITCRGTVMYILDSDDHRVEAGVRFDELSSQNSMALGQYIFSVLGQRTP